MGALFSAANAPCTGNTSDRRGVGATEGGGVADRLLAGTGGADLGKGGGRLAGRLGGASLALVGNSTGVGVASISSTSPVVLSSSDAASGTDPAVVGSAAPFAAGFSVDAGIATSAVLAAVVSSEDGTMSAASFWSVVSDLRSDSS
jgi:hypothetical protein